MEPDIIKKYSTQIDMKSFSLCVIKKNNLQLYVFIYLFIYSVL